MVSNKLLINSEVYLKSGIHIGTKFKTKDMKGFVFKKRNDGLSIMNLQLIDERIRTAAKLLSNYEPEDILIVGRRENVWRAIKKFSKHTGAEVFAGRYPPGCLTNPNLPNHIEKQIIIVTDPWPDRNAIKDALKIGIYVIALCDTNNVFNGIDYVIPCNNKGRKSLGIIFYLLAREYLRNKGLIGSDKELDESLSEFEGDD